MPKEKRIIVGGYEVVPEAQALVTAFAEKKGMNKNQVVLRVMRWFANQPPLVQSLITGLVDDEAGDIYAQSLEAMALQMRRGTLRPPTEDQALGDAKESQGNSRTKSPKGRRAVVGPNGPRVIEEEQEQGS